ncbi:MAG: IS110 family transposase [Pseudomonadota bacterium]|nr:IS110 family transposase [Pseudomonadota bacterium]
MVIKELFIKVIEDTHPIMLRGCLSELLALDGKIAALEQQLRELCKALPAYQALLTVPGFGPIIAAALVSEIGRGEQFANGRQFAAWNGLVPRQHSSGGKSVLMGITKNGGRELRTLLIHGARAVLRFAQRRHDALGHWLRGLIERRGKHKAVVALANKLARIGRKVLRDETPFIAGKSNLAA